MNFVVKFAETAQSFGCQFGEVNNISDGGYERGYAAGYEVGNTEGYTKGHTDGLAERKYETWTITLADGNTVEKDVALL